MIPMNKFESFKHLLQLYWNIWKLSLMCNADIMHQANWVIYSWVRNIRLHIECNMSKCCFQRLAIVHIQIMLPCMYVTTALLYSTVYKYKLVIPKTLQTLFKLLSTLHDPYGLHWKYMWKLHLCYRVILNWYMQKNILFKISTLTILWLWTSSHTIMDALIN